MVYLRAVVLISLAMPVVAANDYFPIDTRSLVDVNSIEALPADVKKILGRQKTGAEGIADKWDKFNETGSIDSRLPLRRFMAGGASSTGALVAYEQGGSRHSIQAVAFSPERSGWVQVGQWTLHEKPYPHSLHFLLEQIDSKEYPAWVIRKRSERLSDRIEKTRPIRRDGPLRELNISDEEVREIQSATLEIFPGSIVNISGVVTGCPCEEGPACSDQVWIVAHRPGVMEGLQLSRISDHWTVGIVQRWWLEFAKVWRIRNTSPARYSELVQKLYDSFPACAIEATESTQASASRPHQP